MYEECIVEEELSWESDEFLDSRTGAVLDPELLVVLALYYILEPFGFALLTDHVSTQTAMFGSLRLLALAVMIHYSAKLFIDAILLQWVRTQMIHMPVELMPAFNGSSDEGQADEVGPAA